MADDNDDYEIKIQAKDEGVRSAADSVSKLQSGMDALTKSSRKASDATNVLSESTGKAHMNAVAYMRQLETLQADSTKYNQVLQDMNESGMVLIGTENKLIAVANEKTGTIARSQAELQRLNSTQKEYVDSVIEMSDTEKQEMATRQMSAEMFTRYYNTLAQIIKLEQTGSADRTAAMNAFRQMSIAEQSEEIKLTDAHLKELQAQDKLSKSGKDLNKTQQDAQKINEQLRSEFEKMLRPADEVANKIRAYQKAGIDGAEISKVMAREITNSADAQRKFGQEVPKEVASLEGEAKAFLKGGDSIKDWSAKISDAASHPMQALKTGIVSATESLGPWGIALTAAATVAIAAGTAIYKLAESAAETALELRNTSLQLGLNVEKMQAYSNAAKLMGVSGEAIQRGMMMLEMQLGRTEEQISGGGGGGGGGFAKMLALMQIAMQDATNHARPLTDILGDFHDKLVQIQDPVERSQLAFAAMGRYNKELVKLLVNTKESWSDLAKEIEAKHLAMWDEKDIEQGEELHKQIEKLDLSWQDFMISVKSMSVTIVLPMLQALGQIVERAQTTIALWKAIANSELGQALKDFAHVDLAEALLGTFKPGPSVQMGLQNLVNATPEPDWTKQQMADSKHQEAIANAIKSGKESIDLAIRQTELENAFKDAIAKGNFERAKGIALQLEQLKDEEKLVTGAKNIERERVAYNALVAHGFENAQQEQQAFLKFSKDLIDENQKLPAAFSDRLFQMIQATGAVREKALPVFKDMIQKMVDEGGRLPTQYEKQLFEIVQNTKGKTQSELLPLWEKYVAGTEDRLGRLSPTILGQIEKSITGADQALRTAGLKVWDQHIKDVTNITGKLPDEEQQILMRLLNNQDSALREEGVKGFKTWIDNAIKQTGRIPDEAIPFIQKMLSDTDKNLQDTGLKYWQTYIEEIVDAHGRLTEEALPKIVDLLNETNAKMRDVGLVLWKKYIQDVIAAHKDLTAALPIIESLMRDTDDKLSKEGVDAWKKYLSSVRDVNGKISDLALPEIEKFINDTNATLQKEGLAGWDDYMKSVMNAHDQLSAQARGVLDRMLESENKLIREHAAKNWSDYVLNAEDVLGQLPDAYLKDIENAIASGNTVLAQAGLKVWQQHVKDVENVLGQLPEKEVQIIQSWIGSTNAILRSEGVKEWSDYARKVLDITGTLPPEMMQYLEQIVTGTDLRLRGKFLPVWNDVVNSVKGKYGELPDDIERVNQKIITQTQLMSKDMVGEIAAGFRKLPDDLASGFADVLLKVKSFKQMMTDEFRTLAHTILQSFFSELFSPLKQELSDLGTQLGQQLKKLISPQSAASGMTSEEAVAARQLETAASQQIQAASSEQTASTSLNGASSTLQSSSANLQTAGGSLQASAAALQAAAVALQSAATSSSVSSSSSDFFGGGDIFGGQSGDASEPDLSVILGAGGGTAGGDDEALSTINSQLLNTSLTSQAGKSFMGLKGSAGSLLQGGLMSGGTMAFMDSLKRTGVTGLLESVGGAAAIGTAIMPGIGSAIGAAVGALTSGIKSLISGIIGKNSYQAGAKEISRDFGGVDYSETDLQNYWTSKGISESQAYPFRKYLLSSPDFIANQLGPAATAQGKTGAFEQALSDVGFNPTTSANFKEAYDLGSLTGDWKELDKTWTDVISKDANFQKQFPNWKDLLATTDDSAKQAATQFETLYGTFEKTGTGLTDLTQYLKDNSDALDEAATQSTLFADQLDKVKAAAANMDTLQPLIDASTGFTAIQTALKSFTPAITDAFTMFTQQGIVTDDLAKKITEFGGDLAAFQKTAGLIQLNNYFGELVKNFEATGEVVPDLAKIMKDFGADMSVLDQAAELKNLKTSLSDIASFKTSVQNLLPDTTGLQDVMSGTWNQDTISKLQAEGLDPSKFENLTNLVSGEQGWSSAISNFQSSGGKIQDSWGAMLKNMLSQYGGAAGQTALQNYSKGFNTITQSLLDQTKSAMDAAYKAERDNVLGYISDAQTQITDKSNQIQTTIEGQFQVVGDNISSAFADASAAAQTSLDEILKKIGEVTTSTVDMLKTVSDATDTTTTTTTTTPTTIDTSGTTTGVIPQGSTIVGVDAYGNPILSTGETLDPNQMIHSMNLIPGAQSGARVKSAGLVQVHDDEVILNSRQQSNAIMKQTMQTPEMHLHFHGDVIGVDNVKKAVTEAWMEAYKRGGFSFLQSKQTF